MLRSDFPFPVRRWPQRLLAVMLGEAFLGLLAIAAVALTLIPMLFAVKPATDRAIEAAQWAIVGLFGAEYAVALVLAPSKRAFLRDPWRLLDLATVAIPLATVLPGVANWLRSSPVLRLVRLARLLALGFRASGIIVREEARRGAAPIAGPVQVSVLRDSTPPSLRPGSWDEFLNWVKAPHAEWYNVSNLGPEHLHAVAAAAGMSPSFGESFQSGVGYPHLEVTDRYASLFLWLPEFSAAGPVARNGLLLLATARSLFTLARQPTNLLQAVAALPALPALAALPFPVRMICAFLHAVMDRNEELIGRFERELNALEDVPVRESRPPFFEQTFRLKKELSAAQSDLWRLKGILAELGEGRLKLPGGGGAEIDFFRRLAGDAEYLYETVVNTRESVLSLIDLHLNVVSFEMNRVMRVLAVVSVLGLIPSAVGGLFGMNLSDNPWPFTLPQVAFGVCFGMVLSLYLFVVKGWLR